ncbi:hypothetical protein [Sphingopyxis sp. GC21]|nr:hypothetical protein [Sphingopyxis sp. GC21]
MTVIKTVLDLIGRIFGACILRVSAQIEIVRWRRRTLKSLNQRRRG